MSNNFVQIFHRFKHSGSLNLNIKDGIAEVFLSSQRKNALCLSMMRDLGRLLDDVNKFDHNVYGLILSGENDTFCTGFDIKSLENHPGNVAGEMCSIMHSNYRKFSSLPLVTIAAIEGYALGGGAELAAWCDHRIMSETATLRFVQAKMGVSPGWGGGIALTNIVGKSKALRMLLGAKKMNGVEAKEFGFADEVAKPGQTLISSREFLKSYLDSSDGSIKAIRGIKRALVTDREFVRAALLRERHSFITLWGAEDNKRAIKKSLEKI